MRIKNTTPYAAGATVTSRAPRQLEMVVVVRGWFDLVHGGRMTVATLEGGNPAGVLTGDVFDGEEGDDAAPLVYPSDFAEFKPRADLLLVGDAHAPAGANVKEIGVRFAIGAWSKSLRAVGPRAWSDRSRSAVLSAPLALTSTPVAWPCAWGGPDDPANPAGSGRVGVEAPSIEVPDVPIRGRDHAGPAGGFGPLSPHWSTRKGKSGKDYGAEFKKEQRFHARDLDWHYFNAAPEDQQVPYPRGDEDVTLQNLSPTLPVLVTRLPAKRVRAFVRGTNAKVREVEMHLDTVFVDARKQLASLVWRGLTPVLRADLEDVPFLYVAVEALHDAPRDVAGYVAAVDKYAADPLDKDEWTPPEAARLVDDGPLPPDPTDDAVSALLKEKLGRSLGPEQAQIKDFIRRAIAAVAPKANLGAALAAGVAASQAPGLKGGLPRTTGGGMDPKSPPRIPLSSVLQQIGERAKEGRAELKKGGRTEGDAELERLEKLSEDPAFRSLDPSLEKGTRPRPAPGPGADYSDQDLSGESFDGQDLAGANFTRAILQGSSFRDARLGQAVFTDAILYEADFTGADLREAKLFEANASSARFDRARLDGAVLDRSSFESASFVSASLSGAKADLSMFNGANFDRAIAKKAVFHQSSFDAAVFTDADLEEATLEGCIASNIDASRIDLRRSKLTKTTFMHAKLPGARLEAARADGASFMFAELDGADFSYALLARTYFMKAHATRARFVSADLRGSRLSDAKLAEADFEGANLFEADLSDSALERTSFKDANLYSAPIYNAGGAGASFSGANLKRVMRDSQ